MKRIGVLGVPGRWSSELLADRLAELTGYRLLIASEDITLRLNKGEASGAGTRLDELDGLVMKKIGPDYSHHLLDRATVLGALHGRGLRMFPKPDVVIRAANRLTCSVELAAAGIPIPDTVITEDVDEAYDAVQRFGQAIFKPLFTSKARGMMRNCWFIASWMSSPGIFPI